MLKTKFFKRKRKQIKNYVKRKKKEHVIKHLENKGIELSGLTPGVQVNDVRLTLSDEINTYSAKIIIDGNILKLSKFEKVEKKSNCKKER